MTIRERLNKLLQEQGMFPEGARAVMDAVTQANSPMDGRWDDQEDGYPKVIMGALWLSVCDEAVKWIDAHYPKAWYRSMFTIDTQPSSD